MPVPNASSTWRMAATIWPRFIWFERGGMVRSGQGSIQSEVFFDNHRPQAHGGNGDLDAGRVVRVSYRQPEGGSQGMHRPEIHLGKGSRILGDAMQQCQLGGARLLKHLDSLLHVAERAHAGGQNHRPARTRHIPQQRMIGNLTRRHFEAGHIQ